MRGQWFGEFKTAQYAGNIIANVDEFQDHFRGVVTFLPGDQRFPTLLIFFATPNKAKKVELSVTPIVAVNRVTLAPLSGQNLKESYSNIHVPKEATVSGEFTDTEMNFSAKTDYGFEILSKLHKDPFDVKSSVLGTGKTWEQFKSYAFDAERQRYLFRGQRAPWKLRSSFHFKQRYDLMRFLREVIPTLHRTLSAQLNRIFNLSNPDENGAFMNLVRHHGYPTPLIDWGYSPFVSAFFTFKDVPKSQQDDGVVRIFIFDQEAWKKDLPQFYFLNPSFLNLSFMEFLAIENERVVPQQAASIVTNIDDVEAYVQFYETQNGKTYLSAIDIPISERNTAMRELTYMGITSGSMFPGLDGTCAEIRERFFDQ